MKTLISGGKIVTVGGKVLSYSEPTITMPNKGDIIKMNLDGTEREYRVLRTEGTVAEVLMMFRVGTNMSWGNSYQYDDSNLDSYLNSTYYNTLSTEAKNAIIPKHIIQYYYTPTNSVYEINHASIADYSTKKILDDVGDRYIYALDIEDIENYFYNTFTEGELWELFVGTSTTASDYGIFLRSTERGTSVFIVFDYGIVNIGINLVQYPAQGAFQIDLSKIEFTPQ